MRTGGSLTHHFEAYGRRGSDEFAHKPDAQVRQVDCCRRLPLLLDWKWSHRHQVVCPERRRCRNVATALEVLLDLRSLEVAKDRGSMTGELRHGAGFPALVSQRTPALTFVQF